MSAFFSCGRGTPDDREGLTRYVTTKLVVVGDGAVGKTSLLQRFVTDEFDERYQPTVFDNQAAPVFVKKKQVMLSLFDTAGQEGYERLRPFMYPESDVILICFSVDNEDSLKNVDQKWLPEVKLYLPKVPILLVGLKTDLRSERRNDQQGSSLSSKPIGCVPYDEGQKMANVIAAKAYFECSAKANQGLMPIFQEAARLSLRHRRRSSLRNFFSSARSTSHDPRSQADRL